MAGPELGGGGALYSRAVATPRGVLLVGGVMEPRQVLVVVVGRHGANRWWSGGRRGGWPGLACRSPGGGGEGHRARWGHACAVWEGRVVVAGGFTWGGYLSSTLLIDLATGGGSQGGTMAAARGWVGEGGRVSGTSAWGWWEAPWWRRGGTQGGREVSCTLWRSVGRRRCGG